MTEAWCILGDFNAVLYKEDIRGGNSRIDRALINIHWYEVFEFTQNHYLTNGLSDHTPMLIKFPPHQSQKENSYFVTCGANIQIFYIYQIKDTKGDLVEGFDMVGQTMMTYYKALLGEQYITRQKIDMDVGDPDYKVAKGYEWQWETQRKVPWTKLIWARLNIPRNAFISWVLINHRLPTKQRLSKFQPQTDTLCVLCSAEEEDEDHLFHSCNYAKTIWKELRQWWRHTPNVQNSSLLLRGLKQSKGPGALKQITSAIITATFYHIWSARNHRIFKKQQITTYQIAYLIKDQVRSRILFLNTCSKKFSGYIDSLLN
ncbi:hypothetical protein Cgig2_019935 [Carnegiea gigantea]|uniref:Reverse transcriptase zinc-binding domain-containing protein n=1 Tax=Carnegiea gigantea TaxID=171969 RepID=A0A9Q1JFR3_9CARY|nr:hypothetical protein Cgig2_019935 [Carnegiea gigantea]